MPGSNFTAEFLVDQSPAEVFNAITNVPSWWTEDFIGHSLNKNDEFETRFFGDVHYSRQLVIEVVPLQKIVWLVTECQLNFLKNKREWEGTKIIFEIGTEGDTTRIHFIHMGLVPGIECYKDCSNGWNYYLQSLLNLITTGKGQPTKIGEKISDSK